MPQSHIELLPVWGADNSSLSKRSFKSKRVSILRHRKPKTKHLKDFYIEVDGQLTFYASETLTRNEPKPCAWLFMKVTPNRYASVWLYQVASTDIDLENVAYAISTWFHDSYRTPGYPPVAVYFSTTLEIRKHDYWYTLYAKHPLLRQCHGELTLSRSKKTNIDWSIDGTDTTLHSLYKQVLCSPGNKVQFSPIV